MANTATANANVNVTTNTTQAQAQIESLEGSIKVLDGAVNLVGGSLETVAGGLALTGALSKEQAEQFEAAAIGAIAFADGAKRTLDGVVNLQEGFGKLAASSKAAAVASRVLGTAIKVATGPIGIAVVAIGAIIGILVKFKDSLGIVGDAVDFVTKGINKLTDAIGLTNTAADEEIEKNKELAESQAFKLELLKAEGADRETLVKKERELLKTRIKAEKDGSEEQKKAVQELALFNAKVRGENAKAQEEADKKRLEEIQKQKEKEADEAEKARQEQIAKEQAFLQQLEDLRIQDLERRAELQVQVSEAIDEFFNNQLSNQQQEENAVLDKYFRLKEAAAENAEDLANLTEAEQAALKAIRDKYNKEEVDEAQKTADAVLSSRLALAQNIGASIGALGALFEQGTAASKAAALAEIAINTATGFVQALDIAQKSAKATGPAAAFAFPIFYASQIAAVLGAVASAKQVLAQTPGGAGGGSTPKPSVPSVGGGFNAFTGALPGTGGAPTTGIGGRTEPIRAYVVTQDVSNGQEAAAAINRRRRLGPG
jgi:hypothetical protein